MSPHKSSFTQILPSNQSGAIFLRTSEALLGSHVLRTLFTGIRKKCYHFNTLFTKPNGSPSKGNPYNKQPRCYLLNSCFVVNFKSEQIVETLIETLQKNLKEHLETTIHSSGGVLTGHKTARDFDEQKLTELQGFRNELHTLITSLSQLQETCKAAFKVPMK